MTRTEREQIIDEIIYKYFGTTWRERKLKSGGKMLRKSKTDRGSKINFAAVFDCDGQLVLAGCDFGNGQRSVYKNFAEILTAANGGAFGRARRKTV